ncbi:MULTISPECIES: ATP-binding protein [Catenuloplanes]|uniref:Histidine kinase/HSP90-like ATPase domain-containing protein n=1 Tax=Catenuloplanes niger TaxID=587534 RepID=A0AAE3ZKP0_9ACTN|nr:ATP-binding protein [Catenuloplanes niger]MDR7319928.1 hypothetical protein [Catenuloplanes niger]
MTVENTGFMVDRLGQDCAPLQFLRELTQNSIEAVKATPEGIGEIVWDVDWLTHSIQGIYKLCITDNGIGMTGQEMARYINALSSSVHQQAHDGNFGVGAKIAAATRNHEGLIYVSWQNGVGERIRLWRDPDTNNYGLASAVVNGKNRYWSKVSDQVKPSLIKTRGTQVTLLGNHADENTMAAPENVKSASRWISYYLNTRYFRFPAGITVKAREGWERPREDTKSNVLRVIHGQEHYLNRHAESSGAVDLTTATAHWWILRDEKALNSNSGSNASSGHVAALYRDELYEMVTGRAGTARLQHFGVIFGTNRVVIYVEPHHSDTGRITSNTARTQLLLNNEPLPWSDWMADFRAGLPVEIRELMEAVSAGSGSSNHQKSIKERLREIRDLFRLSRYRPHLNGAANVSTDNVTPGGAREQSGTSNAGRGRGGGSGGRGSRGGDVYALFLVDEDGTPADQVGGDADPEVIWIGRQEGTRESGLLEDRAAQYLQEQNLLQINSDFRGFTDMIERWCAEYADTPGARSQITEVVQEWFEQALVETILGVLSLCDSPEWTPDELARCWSPESLTAAVMQRYHVDLAIKRSLGSKLGSTRDKRQAAA